MEFTSTMPNFYFLIEFQRDISKLNKQIHDYKKLMDIENEQPKPSLKKFRLWNGEVKNLIILLESRKKALKKAK